MAKPIKIVNVPDRHQRTADLTDTDRIWVHGEGSQQAEWARPSLFANSLPSLLGTLGSVIDGTNDRILIYDQSSDLLKWIQPINAIPTGQVSEAKLATGAVTEAKIGTGAVSTDKIAANAISILDGTTTVSNATMGSSYSMAIQDTFDWDAYEAFFIFAWVAAYGVYSGATGTKAAGFSAQLWNNTTSTELVGQTYGAYINTYTTGNLIAGGTAVMMYQNRPASSGAMNVQIRTKYEFDSTSGSNDSGGLIYVGLKK